MDLVTNVVFGVALPLLLRVLLSVEVRAVELMFNVEDVADWVVRAFSVVFGCPADAVTLLWLGPKVVVGVAWVVKLF